MNASRKANIIELRKFTGLFGIIIMLIGLLFSRFLLSCGLIIFIASCLIHQELKNQLKNFFSSPVLWFMSVLFVLPVISGLWSDDLVNWSQILRIKLPLLLLPVSFAGLDYFTNKDWKKIAGAFLVVVVAGMVVSMWGYFQNVNSVHAAYLRAQTINTPLDNDHVRFSLLVSIAIVTAIFLLIENYRALSKTLITALCLATLALILYLHVLAVRTGLICFYAGSVILIIRLMTKIKNRWRYSWTVICLIIFPFVSWFAFPTFKNRINYLKYDLSTIAHDVHRQGSNDGNRLASIQAGWQIQNQHPLTGVGFGDIKTETDKWYMATQPQISEADMILPSSEWMIYGAGTGWPGFVLFSIVMLIPFFIKTLKKNIWWWLINIFIALSYLFDIGLEVQYGVFVHAFILLWWYKWLSVPPTVQDTGK